MNGLRPFRIEIVGGDISDSDRYIRTWKQIDFKNLKSCSGGLGYAGNVGADLGSEGAAIWQWWAGLRGECGRAGLGSEGAAI